MDSLSALDPLSWQPEYLREHPAYAAGNALGWLYRSGNKQAATGYPLSGRLYLAKSGWLLLSVPNALVRGVFDAMGEPGVELPTAGVMNVPNVDAEILNAHISVMTADEVNQIGPDNISERGHMFGYTLGSLKEIDVKSVAGVSKVWALQVSSPGLANLRKSYGLSPLPKEDQPFHITIAARRKGVLSANGVSKPTDAADNTSDFDHPQSRGELKAAAEEMPWRERAEVYAQDPNTGKIYGGKWDNDGSFALPGGGVDPGEDTTTAALRELEEETGIKATNPRVLPVAPVETPWSDRQRAEKAKLGRGHFAGSRTHFVIADIVKKQRRKNLDYWSAKERGYYTPEEAKAIMEGVSVYSSPGVAMARLQALNHIIEESARRRAAVVKKAGFDKHALSAGTFLNPIRRGLATAGQRLGARGIIKGITAHRNAFRGGFNTLGDSVPEGIMHAERSQALQRGNQFLQTFQPQGFKTYAGRVKTPESIAGHAGQREMYDLLGFRVSSQRGYGQAAADDFMKQLTDAGVKINHSHRLQRPGYHGWNIHGTLDNVPLEFQITPRRLQGLSQANHQLVYKPQQSGVAPAIGRRVYQPFITYGMNTLSPMVPAAQRAAYGAGGLAVGTAAVGGGAAAMGAFNPAVAAAKPPAAMPGGIVAAPTPAPTQVVARPAPVAQPPAPPAIKTSADDQRSRTVKKDLLPGGEADNLPDRDFSAPALAEGAKHEHEHTRNDQIAKEIAKDHLSEDPQYYEKVKQIEKDADEEPKKKKPVLDELQAAKMHSDRREYDRKHEILRRLIQKSPQEWIVDDPKPKYKGITHTPTKFRFHAPQGVIGNQVKAAENSVYAQQFRNLLDFRAPLVYDHAKPVYENVVDHLLNAKQRGDFILASRQKAHLYKSMLDPHYRYQMAQQAALGTLPQMNALDKATQLYGNDVFDTIRSLGKRT